MVTSDDTKTPRPPPLRLVEPPQEPRWSGRRRVAVMIGLGVLVWFLVAGGAWLLARALA